MTTSKIKSLFISFSSAILSIIYPPRCVICSKLVLNGTCYCKSCRKEIRPIEGCCQRCSAKIEHCLCKNWRYDFSKLYYINYYQGNLRACVKRLKYSGCKISGRIIGKELAFVIKRREKMLKNFVLVPVPLHPKRLKWRGYNQTAVISEEIAKLTGVAYFGDTVLSRVKNTISQTGLDHSERKENIGGAFVVKNMFAVKGKSVMLVDDVLTTGATVSECAKILKKSGAKDVLCLTAAYRFKNI